MDINYIIFIVSVLVKCVIFVVAILISVAYLTLLERKALGSIQRRLGPNSVGHINIMYYLFYSSFS